MYKIRDFLFVLLNNVQTKRHVNKQGKTVAVVNKQWDLGSGKVAAPAFHRRYFTTRSLCPHGQFGKEEGARAGAGGRHTSRQ